MPAPGPDFAIRPVDPSDLRAWIGLSNQCRHWQLDHEGLCFEDGLRQPDEPFLRLAAYAPDGSMAGLAESSLGEYGERWKGRAGGFVAVAPLYRRQGLGARLIAEVERFASRAHVRWLEGETREQELAEALPLLAKRGFVELERYQTSRQAPATVNLGGLDGLRDRLRREGIETVDFAAIDSTGARESLYRCSMAIHRDMPHEAHVDWEDPPLATHLRLMFQNPHGLRDGIFVARDGQEIVALTYLVRRPGGDAEVGDTGVLRTHRRRGIARALKMMATRYAAEQRFRHVYTDNRADNAGMLAINTQLGFVPGDVILVFEKTF